MNRPTSPAIGVAERWEQLGEVCVDGASLAVLDPSYVRGTSMPSSDEPIPEGKFSAPYVRGLGVWFWAGFGDGTYVVWGRIVNYGTEGEPDERVAEVRITLVTPEDLKEWRRL